MKFNKATFQQILKGRVDLFGVESNNRLIIPSWLVVYTGFSISCSAKKSAACGLLDWVNSCEKWIACCFYFFLRLVDFRAESPQVWLLTHPPWICLKHELFMIKFVLFGVAYSLNNENCLMLLMKWLKCLIIQWDVQRKWWIDLLNNWIFYQSTLRVNERKHYLILLRGVRKDF